mmetsp:Transcript_39422/g.80870  ORF Transcript_39422/g.80870 Transcript_39422/m.80870 type:complete len:83 (-) Transcript_39422:281-529(-)
MVGAVAWRGGIPYFSTMNREVGTHYSSLTCRRTSRRRAERSPTRVGLVDLIEATTAQPKMILQLPTKKVSLSIMIFSYSCTN